MVQAENEDEGSPPYIEKQRMWTAPAMIMPV